MNKVITEDLRKRVGAVFEGKLAVVDIRSINHDPHPFMIGSRHVVYASDYCCGILGEDAMQRFGCEWRGEKGHRGKKCNKPLDEHTYEVAVFPGRLGEVVKSWSGGGAA